MRKFGFAALLALTAAWIATPSVAEPVEYVKICNIEGLGTGYYYIPGTDTCMHAVTGTTYNTSTEKFENNRFDLAFQGTSIAMAMPTPFIEFGKKFAVAGNVATYETSQALGFAAAVRVNDGLSFSGGVGYGFNKSTAGARAGFNFSW